MAGSRVPALGAASPGIVVTALGLAQLLGWGSSYYLLAVLAPFIHRDTGWPPAWVAAGLSLGLAAAALVSPAVGRAIQAHRGRLVLALASVLFAAGLAGLALAPNLAVYLVAWAVMGLGMGAGLYDAAFATLGRLYGQAARRPITSLTLIAGFSSTLCWPLSASLVEALGWRGTCLAYAGLHFGAALPVLLAVIPRPPTRPDPVPSLEHPTAPARRTDRAVLLLVGTSFTVTAAVAALLSVQLLILLQALGLSLASAVALGALIGPAQVGARALELLAGRFLHPIWTLVAATVLLVAGTGLLAWGALPAAIAILLYGAGAGLESIARGTLPLSLFGADRYAALMGRLALPRLLAQAAAPPIGAVLLDRLGPTGTLVTVVCLCAAAVVTAVAVLWLIRSRTHSTHEAR
ncbi:MAG: MFS transporter [Geminicoccaceae bacterium]